LISGFEPIGAVALPEYRAELKVFRHVETGCQVAHAACDDPENLFAFAFRTPPPNGRGIPHVLEHSVLCGSERFPLKDPFADLLGGSMNTFLNAYTFPDKTVYPAASTVAADYYNIMDVYGDAVFHPLLSEEVFHQEGRHFEWREPDRRRLEVVGVVYNEMKGAYTNPDAVSMKWAVRSLFPTGPYAHDAGGDADRILDLTYRELTEYHRRYYHPSNCRIFLYGGLPTEQQLAFLQERFLGSFRCPPGAVGSDSSIETGPRWKTPRRLAKRYALKRGESLAKRSIFLLNWRLPPVADPLLVLSLELLAEVLLGNDGSPLRKALLASRLGEDIAPASGLDTELRDLVLSVGLRGTDADKARRIEALVGDVLEELTEKGVDPDLIEGACHQAEFANREIRAGGLPYGLRLMRRSLRGWLHDLGPEITLEFRRWMDALLRRLAADRDYLPGLISTHLLANRHRSALVVAPEAGRQERDERRLEKRLARYRRRLDAGQIAEIDRAAARLADFQNRGHGSEGAVQVPVLGVEELPRRVQRIPTARRGGSGRSTYAHAVQSNGIVYVDLAYDIDALGGETALYLPFWCRAVHSLGLDGKTYGEVARELARKTGGVSASPDAGRTVQGAHRRFLYFGFKALEEKTADALDLVKGLLLSADFTDHERLRELWLNMRNGFRTAVRARGHQFASLRAGARLCSSLEWEESWRGVSQYLFLDGKAAHLDREVEEMSGRLERIRDLVLSGQPMINATSDREHVSSAADLLGRVLPSGVPAVGTHDPAPHPVPLPRKSAESLAVTTPVGYVAKTLAASFWGTPESAAESVLGRLLATGALWEKIRMKGGAYGAFASTLALSGVFVFSTYRDPNIIESCDAFRESLAEIAAAPPSEDAVRRAVVATVGADEKPMGPGAKGFAAMSRHLFGITDEARQRRREMILGTTSAALSEAAGRLLESFESGPFVVMAGRRAIEEAGTRMAGLTESVLTIPT